MTAPGWFADPAGQHGLRYWDGTTWTAHVADATMPASVPARTPARPPRRAVGWAGLALCIAGAVAVAVPVAMSLGAPDSPSVRLDGSRQQLSLTPGTTFGVYVDDRDSDGYSLSCSAEDAGGRPIALRSPSWHVMLSDTEMLEYVYDSGSGEVTMTCSADDASVSTRPSTPAGRLVLVTLIGGVAGVLGLAMLIVWLVDRLDPGRAPSTRG